MSITEDAFHNAAAGKAEQSTNARDIEEKKVDDQHAKKINTKVWVLEIKIYNHNVSWQTWINNCVGRNERQFIQYICE